MKYREEWLQSDPDDNSRVPYVSYVVQKSNNNLSVLYRMMFTSAVKDGKVFTSNKELRNTWGGDAQGQDEDGDDDDDEDEVDDDDHSEDDDDDETNEVLEILQAKADPVLKKLQLNIAGGNFFSSETEALLEEIEKHFRCKVEEKEVRTRQKQEKALQFGSLLFHIRNLQYCESCSLPTKDDLKTYAPANHPALASRSRLTKGDMAKTVRSEFEKDLGNKRQNWVKST